MSRLTGLARAARLLGTAAQYLTQRLPGTVLAAAVALLAAIWLWTGTTGSLPQLLSLARPFSPALAQLSWSHPDATVRNGGQLGTLNWQHGGLAVQASDVSIGWAWQAHDPANPTAEGNQLQITLKAGAVHVTDNSPAPTTPPTPPDSLALPWPLDSWAAPIELAFEIGTLTHASAPPLLLQHITGRHIYNPAQSEWQHALSLQTQVSSTPANATDRHASARYTLEARAQAQAPMALNATLTGDLSGTLPGTASTPKPVPARATQRPGKPAAPTATPASGAAHTWQGQLTASVTGTLATPQAVLDAQASLTSQAPPGQHAPSAHVQASLLPWVGQPVRSLQADVTELNLAALWPTLPHTRLSGHAQARPEPADAWAFDVALRNAASGPSDQQRLPVTQLTTTGKVTTTGPAATPNGVTVSRFDARVAGGTVSGHGQWAADAWSGALTATSLQAQALLSALPATTLQGTLHAVPGTTRAASTQAQALASVFTVDMSATQALPLTASRPLPKHAATDKATENSNSNSKLSIQTKRQANISSEFSWDGEQLDVRKLELSSAGARLSAQGTVMRQPFTLSGQAQLTAPGLVVGAKGQLSPEAGAGSLTANLSQATPFAQWLARLPVWPTTWPTPQLSGTASVAATWQGGWQQGLKVDASAQASQLSGVLPSSLASRGSNPGGASAQSSGDSSREHSSDSATDKWAVNNLRWSLSGGLADWQTSLAGQLHWRQWVASLQTSATGAMASAASSPVVPGFDTGQARIRTFQLTLANGNAPASAEATTAAASLQATLSAATGLRWDDNGLSVDAGALQVQATAAARPPGNPTTTRLSWDRTTWSASQWASSGDIAGVNIQLARTLAQVLATAPTDSDPLPGWTGNLTMGGPWQLRWPGTPSTPALLAASLARQSGDLNVPTGQAADLSAITPAVTPTAAHAAAGAIQALGIRTANVTLHSDAHRLTADAEWDSQSGGQASAHAVLARRAPGDNVLPAADSALSGHLTARLPQAGVWSKLAPPGWRVTGSLALDATLGGTLAQPTWQGQLAARQLSARSAVEGLEYSQGELDATLSSNRMDITRFSIQGAGGKERGGSLTLTGHATWAPAPATPTVSLQAQAERLNVSARADRRLTVSGDVTTSLANHTLTLRGKLKADQAQFTLPDDTAPTQGPDVIVRLNKSAPPPPPAEGLRTDVAVNVDLGPAFDVRGQGLQTQLVGQLRISSPPGSDAFSVTGEVRATHGTYKAYGQLLRIEEGVLRFSGPYNDPTLAILALRGSANPGRTSFANDTQKVGVKVSGSARNPHLQLYADPELPDSEKLAWLVLGRPASGAGAEAAALQQAAMALLGSQVKGMEGGLARALGLDEVSLSQETGTTANPGTAVTLGKRLSNRLYVAYEHSLSSAVGALNLYYDVSRRLTVRAQVGGDNALDLIFTLPHD